ncbi:hypothetical protein M9Y10_027909 [Tritrichomonas musculus]|uniref:E3 ubiquitin-protein ligase n=2 Tax=Tritrichomonas musculus TaxID=1915356 RepID=A0ABR2H4D1_9EUKA
MEKQIHDFLQYADPSQIKPFLDSLISQDYDSFEEFSEILERSQPTFHCNTNWEIKTLCACCMNCGLHDNSCICIRCLINGNHIEENHQTYLNYDSNGSCDCGHSEAWDPKGFCKNHRGQSLHPEENLPKEIRENMTNFFESLKKFIISEIQKKKYNFFCEIFEYLIEISQMGDGVLRLASLSFSDENFIQTVLSNSFDFSLQEAKTIKTFIMSYISDDLFLSQFVKVIFPYYKVMYSKISESCHVQEDISQKPPIIGPSIILDQQYHVFFRLGKEESSVDLIQFYREIMIICFDLFKSNPTALEGINSKILVNNFRFTNLVADMYFQRGLMDKMRQFCISIAATLSMIEGYIQPFQTLNDFDDNSSYYDYNLFYIFTSNFYSLSFYLAKKMPFIPEIIEIFVDFLYKNDDLDHPSFLYGLHNLAISTLKNAKNPKEEFDRIIRENKKFHDFEENNKNYKNVYELIYHRACLIPINLITHAMLRDFHLLNENDYPKYYIYTVNKYDQSWFISNDLPFLLSLIQFMFSFTEDKNEFLKFIEKKLSIFDIKNSKSKSQRLFCFIVLISALILNDPKFIGKTKRNLQLTFMTILKYNPGLKSNLNSLNFYSGSIDLNRVMKWYGQVKFENSWHIVLPFISPHDLLSNLLPTILHQMTNDLNNSVLFPFPEFVDSEIIDLKSMMNSTYLYAIIYDIMYETDEPMLYQYALNLFILLYKNEQVKNNKRKENNPSIVAETIDEIVSQIPLDFIEFCNIKINYKRGGVYQSLIDLIENSGSIGLNVLHQTLHKRDEKEMKQIKKKKSKIKIIKEKIIENYKKKALNFDYSKIENLITDVKVTNNDKMYIYVELLESTIPDFLETRYHSKKGSETKLSRLKKCLIAATCGHFSNDYTHLCPHCQFIVNFLLPNYNASNDPNLYSEPDKVYTNSFNNAKNYLKLLKNMIIILDFRSRLKPEVLQDEMNFLLYRNLFIFVLRHSSIINQMPFKNRKSKLGIFIHELITANNSSSLNFIEKFAQNYIEKVHCNNIDYQFLKRVELIRLFYLNSKLEVIIDYDEHFSFRNLIKKYNISEDLIVLTKCTEFNIDKEQLPVFRGIDLPDNFLQIINEPFNIKFVAKEQSEKMICLATGEIIKRKFGLRNMKIPCDLTCQPVLMANGQRINGVGIWKMNYFTFHKSIYRNKKGDEDIGFKNGDPVFLDHESYIDLMDEFISGSLLRKKNKERYEYI